MENGVLLYADVLRKLGFHFLCISFMLGEVNRMSGEKDKTHKGR